MKNEKGDAIVKNTDAQKQQTKKKKRRPKKPKVDVPVGDKGAENSLKDSLDTTENSQEKPKTKAKRHKKKKTVNTGESSATETTDVSEPIKSAAPTKPQIKKAVNNSLPVDINGKNSQENIPKNKMKNSQVVVAQKTNSAGNVSHTSSDQKYSTETNPSGTLNSKQNSEMDIQKNKARDEVLAARAAKKAAKQTKKDSNTPSLVEQSPENKVPDSQSLKMPSKKDENKSVRNTVKPEKSEEFNLVERDGKKLAKMNKALKDPISANSLNVEKKSESIIPVPMIETATKNVSNAPKSREEIMAEREAKKLAKQIMKNKSKIKVTDEGESVANTHEVEMNTEKNPASKTKSEANVKKVGEVKNQLKIENRTNNTVENISSTEGDSKKKATTKAERRALQEAQREAKAKHQQTLKTPAKKDAPKAEEKPKSKELAVKTPEKTETISSVRKLRTFKAKLFDHLEAKLEDQSLFVNSSNIHPVMVSLGEQYAKRIVVGCNARCIAFLHCLKIMIRDFETPSKKEFGRGLDESIKCCIGYLHKCRPLAVSVINAYNYIKVVLTKLPENKPESDLKKYVLELIDIYIRDQIDKAAEAISSYVQGKISDGDVILTYGCSSLINNILEEAHGRGVDFRVIVVDSRPFSEGQELLRRLIAKGIATTCVLINAIGYIMPEVTKILLGAHSLLANGYVMSRTGTAQVALVAKSFNVPVLVCCETHKFSERVQTDAIVYNELGNPNDLVSKTKDCILSKWEKMPSLHPLNLNYDVTPPELVSAVVTEVAILPCTSVPVILRIRPTEMIVKDELYCLIECLK